MGGFSTFLQHCQSKWNRCVPPQFQQYGTKKYLLVLNTFKRQPFSVPTKTTSYSNTKPSPVQSQIVILANTELSPQDTFFFCSIQWSSNPIHKLAVYLIQLLNDMPSQISCFSLSICPLSLNLCPPPLNAARPTPTTPRQVWWMKLWWYQCTNIHITNHNNKLHTSMTLFIVMNPVQAACIQLLCKLYAVSRINMSVKT